MAKACCCADFFSLHFLDQISLSSILKESKAAETLVREPDTPASLEPSGRTAPFPLVKVASSPSPSPTPPPTPTPVALSQNESTTEGSSPSSRVSWLDSAEKLQEFAEFGLPIGGNPFLIAREGYVTSFDWRTRNPHWVFQHVRKDNSTTAAERKNIQFQEDPLVPQLFKSLLSDYRGSGYDRGHLAPAADMRFSETAMQESFYLTNISPQVGEGFNRDYWARVEKFTRDLSKRFGSVQIITGPLFLPERHPTQPSKYQVRYEVVGHPPNVAVPTHFFKAVLVEEKSPVNSPTTSTITGASTGADAKYTLEEESSVQPVVATARRFLIAGFIIPNAPIPESNAIQKYMVPIDHIEKGSGLLLWPDLPKAKYNLSYKPVAAIATTSTTPALPPTTSSDLVTVDERKEGLISTQSTALVTTPAPTQPAIEGAIQVFNLCMSPDNHCKLPPPNWFLRDRPANPK